MRERESMCACACVLSTFAMCELVNLHECRRVQKHCTGVCM